ncbi:MAG: aspartate aminotransferase family protein [Acidiferrobacterales bacterium]|nr:aspartate aminotransferase family protein [Acidiferrobacterales bacterium]
MKFEQSTQLYETAKQYLAGGVSSNFRYIGYGESPVPLFYDKGSGARLTDADGNVYIDYALANGPIILGHAPEVVLKRVRETLAMGQLFAGQTSLEIHLARKLVEIIPCAELVRFASSGTEAIQAAVRLARAATGKSKIVKFEGHYHGWTDNVFISVHPALKDAGAENMPNSVAQTPGQSAAALEDVITLPWNNLDVFAEVLRTRGSEIAGVVMEPINCNTGAIFPLPGYLEGVRELTEKCGVTLIFDEVITGFRVGLSGAQGLLGITPDLAIFAKAMAAGFPLAALAGKKEIMELLHSRPVMHGGTYNANVMCVAAGIATIEYLESNGGEAYREMEELGRHLMHQLERDSRAAGYKFSVQGMGSVFHPIFGSVDSVTNYRQYQRTDLNLMKMFYARLQSAGSRVTARGTWFLSTAHSLDDIAETLEHARHVWRNLDE